MTTRSSRRSGRPALADGEASTPVCVRLGPADYDRVFRQAVRDHVTVPELIRRGIARLLDDDDDDRD